MRLELNWLREEMARERVAGVLDVGKDGKGYALTVPLLSLCDPNFDEAYALLCCFWGQWLQSTHCVLRVEETHVLACFAFDAMPAHGFQELLSSIKSFSQNIA